MWSTIRPPDTLTETKQIIDIETAFGIQIDEDEAMELYDMTVREAVPFIEKKMKEQILC
jgi:acyl carrier protein